MINEIEDALTDISQRDGRLHYCQLEVSKRERNVRLLSGAVLDSATLAAVQEELADRFPDMRFEIGEVRLLRQDPPRLLAVATNLASLRREPSWEAEQMNQLLSGSQVELLLEQDAWAYIRQADGYLGWLYRAYLTEAPPPAPTHLLYAPVGEVRAAPDTGAGLIGRLLMGTRVTVTAVQSDWAQINHGGWLPLSFLCALGTLPVEENGRRQTIIECAHALIGVPYLWGGCTSLGIDSSGFVQLTHRLAGLEIPRDADMQFDAGKPVGEPFRPGDLFFFGSERGHRSISHVGISLGGWHIIHASRTRNGVYLDDIQATSSLRDSYIGARTFLERPQT